MYPKRDYGVTMSGARLGLRSSRGEPANRRQGCALPGRGGGQERKKADGGAEVAFILGSKMVKKE